MSYVYERVTQSILHALDRGVVPWRRPWTVTAAPPANLLTHRPYRGINAVVTWFGGYESPYWVTWLQAEQLGGRIKKGERGTPIMFFRLMDDNGRFPSDSVECEDHVDDDQKASSPGKRRALVRYTHVWNVMQTERLDGHVPSGEKPCLPPDDRAEEVLSAWGDRPRTLHGYRQASYDPRADVIRMPPRDSFSSVAGYYSTRFHEATHATGHPSRLARFDLDAPLPPFGSEDYSREELIAELGAAFLSGTVGLGVDVEVESSACYIAHWLKVLKEDRRFLVKAASQAQREPYRESRRAIDLTQATAAC
jgi:antirestriction protein ArdC